VQRFWANLGLGLADVGMPWFSARLAWELNYLNMHQFSFFLDGMLGCGSKKLIFCQPFHGYGNIQHRSVELSAAYHYFFDSGANINAQIAWRAYARYFPKNATRLQLTFTYPFGL
jgi:hypothetical protein